MTPERWKRLSDLFDRALEVPPAERPAFLVRACGEDVALREDVERLLESDAHADGLGETPAFRIDTRRSAPTLTVGTRLGRYEITGFVGAGGMGEVYRARDPRLDRDVGIKILPAAADITNDQLARFEREARAVAALNHPNILSIHDIGLQDGLPFVVSELLDGETLRATLDRGPLSSREALDLARQIAVGLAAAHAKGIVHRDIKPENLFVTPEGLLKILDFGLAKQTAAFTSRATSETTTLTGEGLILGTAGYMAPEQVRGQPADARADVFAVGAVLYELVTGERAFAGESAIDTISAVLTAEPPALARLPEPWRTVVARCLEKDPGRRFASMKELAAALERPSASPERGAANPRGDRRVLLAVLPFENVSGDADQEYFSDGLTDEMIAQLGRVNPHRLGVIARTSAMKYKHTAKTIDVVGRELGVGYVLEGSVRRSAQRVRVTARLVQVSDQSHVWAESYDREVGDLLALETDLAQAIGEEIRVQLTPGERGRIAKQRSVDPAAYDAYLKGRYFWSRRSRESIEKGVDYFLKAIDIDPEYAAAHAGLADAYLTQLDFNHRPPPEAVALADRAITEALRLDDTLAEPHSSLGHLRLHQFDFQGAEAQFLRAIELNPGYGTAHYYFGNLLAALGRFDEGLVEATKALEIDPMTPHTRLNRVFILYLARRYDSAIKDLHDTIELDPAYTAPYYFLGLVYERQGKYAEAIEQLRRVGPSSYDRGVTVRAAVGFTHAMAGNRVQALQVLRQLEDASAHEYLSSYDLALLHAALGDTDQACALLSKAYAEHSSFLPYLNVDARFDGVRSDPRVQALVQRMRFPDRGDGRRSIERPRRPAPIAVGVVAALALAAAAWFIGVPGRSAPAADAERPTVAVLPFDNPSREAALEWLRSGVPDMLSIGLAESRNVVVVASRQAPDVDVVVAGAVYPRGSDLRIDVRVQDLTTSRLLTAASAEGPDVFAVADELVARLRTAFPGGDDAGRPLAEITTHSIDAFRLFTEGYAAIRANRPTEARQALEAALRLDPGYALAHVAMSEAFSKFGDQKRAEEHLSRAKALANRLSERDRLLVEAREAHFAGQTDRTIRALEAFVARWPAEDTAWDLYVHAYDRDPALRRRILDVLHRWRKAVPGPGAGHMHNHFGYAHLDAGRVEDAIASFDAYRRVSPQEPNAHDSYGEALLVAARPAEAIASYERALAIDPEFGASTIGRSWALGMDGRFDEALVGLATLEDLGERGGIGWRHVHVMRTIVASRAGRYREAWAVAERGLKLARQLQSLAIAVELRLASAFAALDASQWPAARTHARAALSLLDQDPARAEPIFDRGRLRSFALYILGVADARTGRLASAERALETQRSAGPVADVPAIWWQQALAGEIAFARGDLAGAERLWRGGVPKRKIDFNLRQATIVFSNQLPQRDWEARLQQARGDLAGAAATYERLNRPSLGTPWTAMVEPRFVLERGRLLDRAGDLEGARAEYQRFLDLWRGADDELPELAETRRYLKNASAPRR